jgi:hypothetical protein
MRRIKLVIAAATLTIWSLAAAVGAQTPQATRRATFVDTPTTTSDVQLLACDGTFRGGCGPGRFWRFGRNGWGCYFC